MTYQIDDAKIIYADLDPKEGVVLHLDTKNYYRLNETGQVIWRALQDQSTPESIAKRLEREFEVSYEAALEDVNRLIQELDRENLLVKQENTVTPEQISQARQSKTSA